MSTKNDHKNKHVSMEHRGNGHDRENDKHELFSDRTKTRASTSTRASGGSERVEVVIETITTARFQTFVLRLHLGNGVKLLKA